MEFWKNRSSAIITVVLTLAIGGVLGYNLALKGSILGIKIPFLSEVDKGVVYKLQYAGQPSVFRAVKFDLFWQVWELLEQKYIEPNDFSILKMVDGAIAGMVAALGDPYTMYIPEEPKKISEGDLAGSFSGVGIELGYKNQTLAIAAPINDSPAAKAGAQAGDLIIHIKDERNNVDEDTYDWSLEKAQTVLRGQKGSEVTITLFREEYNDNLPFEVTIIRDEIKIDSVNLEFLDRNGAKYAYVKLNRFSERTFDEWNAAVNQILAQKGTLAGLVLDLRNNPGGYFNEAIHVASEFIAEGVVVSEKGRYESRDFRATGKGRLVGMPLVVLVNGGSASSSEIVAGALRDHEAAKLVGSKTFGKGLIQERIDLENGAGLNVTIAKWVRPNGEWLDENGIEPDVEAEDERESEADETLEAAWAAFDI